MLIILDLDCSKICVRDKSSKKLVGEIHRILGNLGSQRIGLVVTSIVPILMGEKAETSIITTTVISNHPSEIYNLFIFIILIPFIIN